MSASSDGVLVVSADRLFAGAVRAYLDGRQGPRVVGIANDGLQALAFVGRRPPEAVLVLGDLPRLSPSALARQVRRRWPQVAVVVLGRADNDDATVLLPDADSGAVLEAVASPARAGGLPPGRPPGVELLESLTRRERVIVKMLAEGLAIREIGRRLVVSQHTVRTHMQNLYAKLGCHSRLDVVRFAARYGLVGDAAEEAGAS